MKAAAQAKKAADAGLAQLQTRAPATEIVIADPSALAELSEQVAAWLDPADQEKMKLALEGLEITVWAGTGEPRATGALPVPATRQENVHPDVCAVVGGIV
jgi:hypothetical protein